VLAIGFKEGGDYSISYTKEYQVQFKDGSTKIYSEANFENLLKDNRADYEYVTDTHGGTYIPESRSLYDYLKYILRIVLLMFLTFFVEAIVFYFFGSRRSRNYFWLLLANIISYSIATLLLWISSVYIDNSLANLVVWTIVECIVVLIEYYILKLSLSKYYNKKQILLFVIVANFITAIIGLVISFI
jgi:hypothetical protein